MFAEKYESCMCRELLGHDISKEDEMEQVLEQGLFVRFLSMCCKRHNRNTGEDDIDAAYKGGIEMGIYYNPEDLEKFASIGEESPKLAEKFFNYYNSVFEEGALTAREKSLIALAVAHTVQCPYCIDAYTNDCLNKGVSPEQMMEAVHVAAAIRGGASLVHGVQMKNMIKKLEL